MKKVILLLLSVFIVLSLVSCNSKSSGVVSSTDDSDITTEGEKNTAETTEITTEEHENTTGTPIVTTEKLPEVTTEGEKDTVETTEITTEVPNVTTEDETTDVGVQYKLEITGSSYDLHNEPKQTYAPGEKVTIILNWETESYHLVYVNGVEVKRDLEANDDWYTFAYYTFIMPSEDVVVNIECVAVSIPEASEEIEAPSYGDDIPLLTMSSLSEYNELLNSGKLPKNFVLYEKIKAIGKFDSLVITSDAYQNDYSEYLYSLIDSTGHELSLYVYSIDSYIDRYGTLPTKSTVSVTDTTNMRSPAEAAKGVYVSNRAMYKYLQDGSLLSVVWVEQDVVFSLSVSESYVTLSDYPTDVSTFVSELLNVNSASKAIDSLSAELNK